MVLFTASKTNNNYRELNLVNDHGQSTIPIIIFKDQTWFKSLRNADEFTSILIQHIRSHLQNSSQLAERHSLVSWHHKLCSGQFSYC